MSTTITGSFNSGQAYLQSLRSQYCPEPIVSKAETLSHYYHTLDSILERVNHYKQQGDDQNLYVELMRYAQLGTKLATHPNWHKPSNKSDRDRVNEVVDIVMEELARFQSVLIQAYNKELRRQAQLQLEQEEKEEELIARIESVYVHVDRSLCCFVGEGKVFCIYNNNWKQMHGSGLIELFFDSGTQKLQIVVHETSIFWLIPPLKTKGPRGLILTLSALFDEKGDDNFVLALKFRSENEQRSFALTVENSLTVEQVLRKPTTRDHRLTSSFSAKRLPLFQPRTSYSSNRRSSLGASSQSSFDTLPFLVGHSSHNVIDQPRASFESTSSIMSARFASGATGYPTQSPPALRESSPPLPQHRHRRHSRASSVRHEVERPPRRLRTQTSRQFDASLMEVTRSNLDHAQRELDNSRRRRDLQLSNFADQMVGDLEYSLGSADNGSS